MKLPMCLQILSPAIIAAGLCVILPGCEASSTVPPAEQIPTIQKTGDPNLDFWLLINRETAVTRRLGNDPYAEILAAKKIMQESTQDIDPELVNWSLRVLRYHSESSMLQQVMNLSEAEYKAKGRPKSDSDSALFAARVAKSLLSDIASLHEDGVRLQQAMTQKYGKDFPPCEF